MKKSIVITLVIISIFAASCSPQVTVTSEVTVTLPTATQTPEPSATPIPTAVYTPTPAKDIITNPSGIGFELGAQIEGQPEGVRAVVDIVPSESMNAEKQAEFEIRTNPMTYGFKEGETHLVYIPTPDDPYKKFRVELQHTSNPADVIAVFGSTDFVWNPDMLISDDNNPVFLKAGQVLDLKDGAPHTGSGLANDFYDVIRRNFPRTQYFIFISTDGKQAVQVNFAVTDIDSGSGFLYFRDKVRGTLKYMYVEGFNENNSFVEALH